MNWEDHRKSHRGGRNPQIISIFLEEDKEGSGDDLSTNQMASELVKWKPYSCPTLQSFKGKEAEGNEAYLFDISRVEQIFDYLVKDQQIWLPEGKKIPPSKRLRNKRYCKWHNAYNHSTTNCLVFRNTIQRALKEGKLRLIEKGNEMQVDVNPFTSTDISMVSATRFPSKSRPNVGG